MEQPYYNDPPERSVFLRPRSWRLRGPGAPEDRAPYPRWFTIPVRAAMAGFEIYALVYITWYHQQRQAKDERSDAEIVLAGVGLAAALDLLISVLSLVGAYEASGSCCAGFVDVIPGVLCVVGGFSVLWLELRPEDPLRDSRERAGSLGMAVCALHFTASLGGCIGCCIICGRMSRAKGAKKTAASELACAPGTAAAPSDTSPTDPAVGVQESRHEEGIKGTGSTDGFHIDKPNTTKDGKGGYPARTVEEV